MTLEQPKFNRRSIRLKGYDYSQIGAYYLTMCTQGRIAWLAKPGDDALVLTKAGQIVREEWLRTELIRSEVRLDEFVVMPNHFHAILLVVQQRLKMTHANNDQRATWRVAPTETLSPGSIGSIVAQFKSVCTKRIRESGLKIFAWQRGYYEHVVRDDIDLNEIREYIHYNPMKWAIDPENPDHALKFANAEDSL